MMRGVSKVFWLSRDKVQSWPSSDALVANEHCFEIWKKEPKAIGVTWRGIHMGELCLVMFKKTCGKLFLRKGQKGSFHLITHERLEELLAIENSDAVFIQHIQSHLSEGQEVVCKICGKTAREMKGEK